MKRAMGRGQRVFYYLVGLLAYWSINLYFLTIHRVSSPRVRNALNRREPAVAIYSFWHSHQLGAVMHYRRMPGRLLVSRSRDGEYVARFAQRMGFMPVRGSTSRGGVEALKELIGIIKDGLRVAITPDGPRGPQYSIGPGVILLAQRTGRPIRPAVVGLSSFWELPSWDRFRIPKPFCVCYGCWGKDIHVPPDADNAQRKELAQLLQKRMMVLEKHADRVARQWRRTRGRVDDLEFE